MKKLMFLFTILLFVSCENNMSSEIKDDLDGNVIDDNNIFLNCDQLLDMSDLKLYSFVPFTDEEWRTMSYDYKLEQRQIPNDFLRDMTSKELFYQVVYTDLSKNMLVFNTEQQGFESVKCLNMIPELLNRTDAGYVLLELLHKIDPAKITGLDCFWFDHCLQIILAQSIVINRMTDEDIDNYIQQQIRCHDTIVELSKSNDNWEYPQSVKTILFGLGNVMIRYDFKPFMQTLNRNPDTNELIWDTQYITEQYALQLIDYIKQFIKTKK